MIAALFVQPDGVYANRDGVDLWAGPPDARLYSGPDPVIAHPPCARWGRYWSGGPSAPNTRRKGDDGGCFASALHNVRQWGGVLEHPAASHAWPWHGINKPPHTGGWVVAGDGHGWTCHVEQGWYGHPARKATWLYAVGCKLPSLKWGCRPTGSGVRLYDGYHSQEERRRAIKTGVCQRLSKHQREATPPEFAEVLIEMARSVER